MNSTVHTLDDFTQVALRDAPDHIQQELKYNEVGASRENVGLYSLDGQYYMIKKAVRLRDPDSDKFESNPMDAKTVLNEYIAFKLYQKLGATVPNIKLIKLPTAVSDDANAAPSYAIASEFVKGYTTAYRVLMPEHADAELDDPSHHFWAHAQCRDQRKKMLSEQRIVGKPIRNMSPIYAGAIWAYDLDAIGWAYENFGFVEKDDSFDAVKIDAGNSCLLTHQVYQQDGQPAKISGLYQPVTITAPAGDSQLPRTRHLAPTINSDITKLFYTEFNAESYTSRQGYSRFVDTFGYLSTEQNKALYHQIASITDVELASLVLDDSVIQALVDSDESLETYLLEVYNELRARQALFDILAKQQTLSKENVAAHAKSQPVDVAQFSQLLIESKAVTRVTEAKENAAVDTKTGNDPKNNLVRSWKISSRVAWNATFGSDWQVINHDVNRFGPGTGLALAYTIAGTIGALFVPEVAIALLAVVVGGATLRLLQNYYRYKTVESNINAQVLTAQYDLDVLKVALGQETMNVSRLGEYASGLKVQIEKIESMDDLHQLSDESRLDALLGEQSKLNLLYQQRLHELPSSTDSEQVPQSLMELAASSPKATA